MLVRHVNNQLAALPFVVFVDQVIQLLQGESLLDGLHPVLSRELDHFSEDGVAPKQASDDLNVPEHKVTSGHMETGFRETILEFVRSAIVFDGDYMSLEDTLFFQIALT